MNRHLLDVKIPDQWDRRGLPGWTYHSDAFLELEKEHLFRRHWQIIGHVSDIPNPGDYLTLDAVGERALVIRGRDGVVRAFHNLCRHRGSRVVADEKGNCRNALVCPFHGWVYNLDGTLRGAAQPQSFPDMDRSQFGLRPLDCEIWMGMIFIRFQSGSQPSVASLLQPIEAEAAHYKMEEMVPSAEIYQAPTAVNWKAVRDVDNEGYHVAMAHPALQDLYGTTYFDEPFKNGISRSFASFYPSGGRRWSVRNYIKHAPIRQDLPDYLQRAWLYYGIFPNAVIAFTPHTALFYQEFPLSTGKTMQRSGVYHYQSESREQKATRYLATRIDRDTSAEDVQLSVWSNESMLSSAFEGFNLSNLEFGVRTHHDHVRRAIPVATVEAYPGEGRIAALNQEMSQ